MGYYTTKYNGLYLFIYFPKSCFVYLYVRTPGNVKRVFPWRITLLVLYKFHLFVSKVAYTLFFAYAAIINEIPDLFRVKDRLLTTLFSSSLMLVFG